MRIKRGFDYRIIFTAIYIVVAFACFAHGLKPAGATRHENFSYLGIPSVGLLSGVESLHLDNNTLRTPDLDVGSYTKKNSNRTLLLGHSTTVFRGLKDILLGQYIIYNGGVYRINSISLSKKSEINMNKLLSNDGSGIDTLVVMTCAGELYENGDASHRLILTAIKQD